MSLHVRTPAYYSSALSRASRCKVWLKLESLQPTGSFKLRGIGLACQHYARSGAERFVSSSGGNAGIAAAYVGRELGIPVTVVVPETTPARARRLISDMGADILIHGASWHEANEHALAMLTGSDAFIHPFDDPVVWNGHSTIIDEVVEAGLQPDLVVLSVGGGGLLSGVVEGLRRHNLAIPVLAVGTTGASCLAQSAARNERIVLPAIDSIATSLGARQVAEHAFALLSKHRIGCAVVSDLQAVNACLRFLDDHRILVEPACGASIATIYEQVAELADFQNILLIVCGGAIATAEQLTAWRRSLASASAS
ncbi:serine dehydratase [Bosea sp. Root483D1]|uniref:pyridoxal-phosphate dependent enzyme n=1 Tax=Bosea sp. Root483D1 TaxID=1736544 RepID=UPI000709E420|nr:pyridoxal-phosphate dependent enzyme [Bosea sp. Root483D1]KRE11834.1 serine dehydratase [Bosea sp. Root483D1]